MRTGQGLGSPLGRTILATAVGCALFAQSAVAQHPPSRDEMKKMMERARRNDHAPKLGESAPDFKLKTLDSKREVALAGFRGSKPVVLVFGSYT